MKASRRDMFALAGAAIALGASQPSGAAAGGLELSNPADRLKAYMLMRGALNEQLVIGWLIGRYFGVVDSELRPLYGVASATFARFRATTGGGYAGASYEVYFFTDLQTGKALESFTNPYTNEVLSISMSGFPPAKINIGPDLSFAYPGTMPGLSLNHDWGPVKTIGNDVWLVEETFGKFQIPNASKSFRYNEIVTLHAKRSDLEAHGATHVPCQTEYQSIGDWEAWLKMGDHPGNLICNGFGGYGTALESLPAEWLEAARQFRPEVLRNPAALVDEALKT